MSIRYANRKIEDIRPIGKSKNYTYIYYIGTTRVTVEYLSQFEKRYSTRKITPYLVGGSKRILHQKYLGLRRNRRIYRNL